MGFAETPHTYSIVNHVSFVVVLSGIVAQNGQRSFLFLYIQRCFFASFLTCVALPVSLNQSPHESHQIIVSLSAVMIQTVYDNFDIDISKNLQTIYLFNVFNGLQQNKRFQKQVEQLCAILNFITRGQQCIILVA